MKRLFIYFNLINLLNLNFLYALENEQNKKDQSPNFIVLYLSHFNWKHTSKEMIINRPDTKSLVYKTPNLEKLFKRGMLFPHHHSPAPITIASHNSFLHGLTPARLLNTTSNPRYSIDFYQGQTTIPHALKLINQEYLTVHFGVWQIPSISPSKAGFDFHTYEFYNSNDYISPDTLLGKAQDFIYEHINNSKPFYIQLSFNPIFQHTSTQKERERNITNFDSQLGSFINYLDKYKIFKNTYLIILSDHGGEKNISLDNPEVQDQRDLTQFHIQTPLFIKGPKVLESYLNHQSIASWDLLPTFIDLADGNPKDLLNLTEGFSIKSLLLKGNAGRISRGHHALIFHYPYHQGEPQSAIILDNHKLILNLDSQSKQLYDIKKDFFERNNIAQKQKNKVNTLEQLLKHYLNRVGAEDILTTRQNYIQYIREIRVPKEESILNDLRKKFKSQPKQTQKEIEEKLKVLRKLKEEVEFNQYRALKFHNTEL